LLDPFEGMLARININDSRPLLQRFEQKYPFIKTELLRMSAEPLLNRIITEDRAGHNVVDVINNSVINPLKKLRLVQPIVQVLANAFSATSRHGPSRYSL
jgi:hypothetical protein